MSETTPNIVLIASPHARDGEKSPFLSLVRRHAPILKQFSIHCTGGTALSLTGTGMYDRAEVTTHRLGSHGGLVEVAALVAKGECVAVLLLIDARDPHHDDVQIQILKRIANKRGVRLVITYADAARWALFEAPRWLDSYGPANRFRFQWEPENWYEGIKNNHHRLALHEQTLGLTANTGSKTQLIEFVRDNAYTLVRHYRILATGTSGWLLKLLLANESQEREFMALLLSRQPIDEMVQALKSLGARASSVQTILDEFPTLRNQLLIMPEPELAEKLIPLPPGPDGGDILLANEVLENCCDTVVSFHEPAESRPFGGGGRMLEQTCQLPEVDTVCLDNWRSAEDWVRGLRLELALPKTSLRPYQVLRERFDLQEVVAVGFDDQPYSDNDLGRALHRACAGYLNATITRLVNEGGGRVVVSWGFVLRKVVEELKQLYASGLLDKPPDRSPGLMWSPAVGVLPVQPDLGAESIAGDLRDFYGGTVEAFTRPGFVLPGPLQLQDEQLMNALKDANVVLTSAAPWDEESTLYLRSGVNPDLLPSPSDPNIVGTIGGVFVNRDGSEAQSQKGLLVGLNYDGLATAAAKGSVIFVCGGVNRRPVIRAALEGRLVSVLLTSQQTLQWLLEDAPTVPQTVQEIRRKAATITAPYGVAEAFPLDVSGTLYVRCGSIEGSHDTSSRFEPEEGGEISVAVYVDTEDDDAAQRILRAADDLARAMGYGDPVDVGIQVGSLFRRSKAKAAEILTSHELKSLLVKLERTLELVALDLRQAQVDRDEATAVAVLLSELKDTASACIRVGSILIAKFTTREGAAVVVKTLSQVEIRAFERFPEIQTHPDRVLQALAAALDRTPPALDGAAPTSESRECPRCRTQNDFELPVGAAGWHGRAFWLGMCHGCSVELFLIPGHDGVSWDLAPKTLGE